MDVSEQLVADLKKLIIDSLVLEDTSPQDIDSDAPLFIEGLGLDSIDALELAMALEEQYGVTIEEDPEENKKIFASVRSLALFVTERRSR